MAIRSYDVLFTDEDLALAKERGISHNCLRKRRKAGYTKKQCLNTPLQVRLKKYCINKEGKRVVWEEGK